MEVINAIRSRRSEMNVPNQKRPHLYIAAEDREAFLNGQGYLRRLAMTGEITVSAEPPAGADSMVSVVTRDARCFLPLSELVDLDKERARITKELEKNRGFLEGQRKSLPTRTSSPGHRKTWSPPSGTARRSSRR